MKFHKMSEDKIKIEIDSEDLKERGITLEDLKYGNEVTSNLFQEIMERAVFEFEFDVDNKAVLVEATPVNFNKIDVIITRVNGDQNEQEIMNKLNLINKIKEKSKEIRKSTNKNQPINNNEQKIKKTSTLLVRFKELDDVCSSSKVAYTYFEGKDKLYKYEGEFYLSLDLKTNKINVDDKILKNAFIEFGDIEEGLSESFIEEHGEVILKKNVIINLKEV